LLRGALQVPNEDGDSAACASLYACFVYVFFTQVSGSWGNLRGDIGAVAVGGGDYLGRVAYDGVFFMWAGVVLMNVVTGLMVDSFGAIREEKGARAEVLATECFVCGISMGAYEDLGMAGPSFGKHQGGEHDLWNYALYASYLGAKDPTDHSGVEGFVASQLGNGLGAPLLDWVPGRTSVAIEAHKEALLAASGGSKAGGGGGSSGNSKDGGDDGGDGGGGGAGTAAALAALLDEMAALRSEMRQLAEKG